MNTNNTMIRKVLEYIPNEKLEIRRAVGDKIVIVFVNHKSMMTILPSNTWLEVKRIIDFRINDIKLDECSICCSDKLIGITNVSCNKCAVCYCVGCFYKLLIINQGLMICPFCKYTSGDLIPIHILKNRIENRLDMYAKEIRDEIIKYLE